MVWIFGEILVWGGSNRRVREDDVRNVVGLPGIVVFKKGHAPDNYVSAVSAGRPEETTDPKEFPFNVSVPTNPPNFRPSVRAEHTAIVGRQ